MIFIFIFLIRVYRSGIAPFLATSCRFEPTCSRFAEEALKQHGLYKGSYLFLKRIVRCSTFRSIGYDQLS
jgi:hypothetical protein